MSYEVPMFQDPETGEVYENAVLKFTAFRGHNEGGKFGFDGIEVSVYKDLDASKSRKSRMKFSANYLLGLTPPTVTTDADGKEVSTPAQTQLSDEALGRVKDAMLAQLYTEYSALGVFAEAKKV